MNIIDKVILEWSYKTKKGYPDLTNKEDLRLFESMFGFNPTEPVNEAPTLAYDSLSNDAQAVANDLIELLGVDKEQIKADSSNKFYIYVPTEDRPTMFNKVEAAERFGKARAERSGNWKVGNVIFLLKPTGEKAGEFFELKPQQLGITLDTKISLSQLRNELIQGVKNNKALSDTQKKVLIYALTDTEYISDEEKEQLPNGLFNEVNKNFGEPHGALLYGEENGYDSVEFPKEGNYPLIDYILYKGDERTQVSAKTAKGMGNTVKYNDVIRLAELAGGEVPPKIKEYSDIIERNSVMTGAFEAIAKFGSQELKNAVEDYKEKYPEFPKLDKGPDGKQSHFDRIQIEKQFVKDINTDPDLNFNELFNNYVEVKYIKYQLNSNTLKGAYSEITSGNFNVKHHSKNSSGHDSDKLGLAVSKIV